MIIFGSRPRYKTLNSGTFFCPHCQQERTYEHKQARNYFTLYFIPVFPVDSPTEFIECQKCGRTYSEDVLKFKASAPRPDAARFLTSIQENLKRGYSAEYLVRDLTADGMDRDLANDMVNKMLGERPRECPKCGLTYASSVQSCWDDGTELEPKRG